MALIIVVGIRLSGLLASLGAETQGPEKAPVSLWDLAQSKQTVHRFSTLFTAQNVRDHLATEEGLAAAIAWCRQTAVTKVYNDERVTVNLPRWKYRTAKEKSLWAAWPLPRRPRLGRARQQSADRHGMGSLASPRAARQPLRRSVVVRPDGPSARSGKHASPPRRPQEAHRRTP